MSDTSITSETRAAPATSRRRAVNFALWALQAVLALMFAMAGFAKVGGDAAMVEMFATIGVGQWFRYLVGALGSPGLWACCSRGCRGWQRSGWSA